MGNRGDSQPAACTQPASTSPDQDSESWAVLLPSPANNPSMPSITVGESWAAVCCGSPEEQRNSVMMQKETENPVAYPGGERDQRGRDNQMEKKKKSESKCFLIIIVSREHRMTPHGPSWL